MNNSNLKRQFDAWYESTFAKMDIGTYLKDRDVCRAVAWSAYQHSYYRNAKYAEQYPELASDTVKEPEKC